MDRFFDYLMSNSMNLTFSIGPFITCFLTIFILTIYIWFIIYKSKSNFQFGMKASFVVIALMMVRMLIPINFPFTYSVEIEKYFEPLRNFFYHHFEFDGEIILLFEILLIVWFAGAVICLVRFFRSRIKIRRYFGAYILKKEQRIFYEQFLEKSKISSLDIAILPGNHTAGIFGVIHPILVLPDENLPEEEWGFIIRHELEHYRHHDLVLLFLLDLLVCFHWWNPFVYILRKHFTLVLEISNDQMVIKGMNEREKLEYLSSLLHAAKSYSQQQYDLSLVQSSHMEIRMKRILETPERSHLKLRSALHAIILFSLLIVSFLVVPEPKGRISPEVEEETFSITPENAYLVPQGEQYQLYVDGSYMGMVEEESIERSFPDIPIYRFDQGGATR